MTKLWARKLFVFSIVAITSLSVMMSVDFMVPDSHNLLTYVWLAQQVNKGCFGTLYSLNLSITHVIFVK